LDEACWLEANAADAIIARGLKAGGHRAILVSRDVITHPETFALVPQVVRAVNAQARATSRHSGPGRTRVVAG